MSLRIQCSTKRVACSSESSLGDMMGETYLFVVLWVVDGVEDMISKCIIKFVSSVFTIRTKINVSRNNADNSPIGNRAVFMWSPSTARRIISINHLNDFSISRWPLFCFLGGAVLDFHFVTKRQCFMQQISNDAFFLDKTRSAS